MIVAQGLILKVLRFSFIIKKHCDLKKKKKQTWKILPIDNKVLLSFIPLLTFFMLNSIGMQSIYLV